MKSIDNGVSRGDYAYDISNQLTTDSQKLAGRSVRTLSYNYGADGLRTSVTFPDSHSVGLAWTARAQLHSVSADGPPPLATYSYDKAGRNTAVIHKNGITESKPYDAAGELVSNTHLKGGTAISGHGYTLDATGRRTGETFADGSTPTRAYGYDNADQVMSASYGGSLTDAYHYDAAGNRATATATVASLGGGAGRREGSLTMNGVACLPLNEERNPRGFVVLFVSSARPIFGQSRPTRVLTKLLAA